MLQVMLDEITWNPDSLEWFCAQCGRTSDHLREEDAESEIEIVRAGRESDLDGSSENDIVGVGHPIAEHVHSAQGCSGHLSRIPTNRRCCTIHYARVDLRTAADSIGHSCCFAVSDD